MRTVSAAHTCIERTFEGRAPFETVASVHPCVAHDIVIIVSHAVLKIKTSKSVRGPTDLLTRFPRCACATRFDSTRCRRTPDVGKRMCVLYRPKIRHVDTVMISIWTRVRTIKVRDRTHLAAIVACNYNRPRPWPCAWHIQLFSEHGASMRYGCLHRNCKQLIVRIIRDVPPPLTAVAVVIDQK